MRALLSPPALAEQIGIPERTLAQWRYIGTGPAYVKTGRHIRYKPEDVDAWIESQRRGGPNAAA